MDKVFRTLGRILKLVEDMNHADVVYLIARMQEVAERKADGENK